ncbi:MAG TPA: LysR family transcriptional regulator, partial [Ruminococcaceae bacterium]|nr:LysR family transcriptional regulator [Oscillospiraceae bacterium]
MKQSFKIFLLTAEEMSISRAAKRAYVTQQCVSDHIKRLEDEYGVALFE